MSFPESSATPTSLTPVLYSFRRCPYAMRARLALYYARQSVELREIILKNKPETMLAVSPKGTVPVMLLASGKVLEESLDIMLWALTESDPQALLRNRDVALAWVRRNDDEFKPWLDKYKYFDRHPELPQETYRKQAGVFLAALDVVLSQQTYLGGDTPDLADLAVWPFVRQFAGVDSNWFWQCEYEHLRAWLQDYLDSLAFAAIMPKYPVWQVGDTCTYFPKGAN